ncbi:hypothetical protein HHI36_011685 [Cryptolaemus montrouzieri]|uniref:Uncharacterized protein n=1 Tax=Cryptolaemus montrouzieri TaxID=559131 RepID=A0ABD2MN98_9CUCU
MAPGGSDVKSNAPTKSCRNCGIMPKINVSTSFSAKPKHNKNNRPSNYEKKSATVTDETQHQVEQVPSVAKKSTIQVHVDNTDKDHMTHDRKSDAKDSNMDPQQETNPAESRQWFEGNLEGTKEQKLSIDQTTEKK